MTVNKPIYQDPYKTSNLYTNSDLSGLNYHNLGLISRHISNIKSRLDVDTSVDFCGIKLSMPLIVSPMPDIGNAKLITTVRKLGGFGYIHRFQTITEQITEYQKCPSAVGCATGITGDFLERFDKLYNRGCKHFCLDTANGAHTQLSDALYQLRDYPKDYYLIAGNVASAECFNWLAHIVYNGKFMIDGIRVGIGGGSACTTKFATGLEYPMISSILECVDKNERKNNIIIIADGGIKQPMDYCKALAVGADVVMCGGIFAGTEESSGTTIKSNDELYKVFRGAASFSTQQEYNGQRPLFVEGDEQLIPYTGPIEKIIKKFDAGLRSSMSYMNAQDLREYKQNVDWCIIK